MEGTPAVVAEKPQSGKSNGSSNDDIKLYLNQIFHGEEYVELEDFDISPGCPPGENFVADVIRVVVYGKRMHKGKREDFRKSVIIKRVPNADSLSHSFHDCFIFFENEANAYETVLPMCRNYIAQKSKSQFVKMCFPEYYGGTRTLLALQDLQTEGFQVVNRVKGFSKAECSAILQELSTFHAISFAMKKQDTDAFTRMTQDLKETIFRDVHKENVMGVIWENSLKFCLRSMDESEEPKLKEVADKLRVYSGRVLSTLLHIVNKSNVSKFDVICHGDLWNNNIMLKYCDSGFPAGVKFIDLQAMRYGSCVLDVMHILFTSSRPSVLRDHLDLLLNEYHLHLVENLRNLGEVPDFTYSELKAEMKSKILFGIFVSCLMFTCITRTSVPEPPKVEDISVRKLESEMEHMYKDLNDGYHERIRALILALTDFNLI